jgi:SAM-dependent methyltransferase
MKRALNLSNKRWGKEIWENKGRAHSAAGVIFGTGFSLSQVERQTQKYLPLIQRHFLSRLIPNARILDAGVGPLARFAIQFAQRGFQVVGLDIAPATLMKAQAAINASKFPIKLVEGDILDLSAFQGEFDGVFCFESFYHIPAHLSLNALRQFHCCLKNQGIVFIQFAVEDEVSIRFLLQKLFYFSVFKLAKPVLKTFGRESFHVTVTRQSTAEIRDMIALAGFEVIHQDENFFLLKKLVADFA